MKVKAGKERVPQQLDSVNEDTYVYKINKISTAGQSHHMLAIECHRLGGVNHSPTMERVTMQDQPVLANS